MVSEFVTSAAEATASSLIGSATGSAAEKGAQNPAVDMNKQPKSVKVGLKASEILVSSVMTSIAVTMFNRMSKNIKGYAFIMLAVALSAISAVAAAFIKIRM